MADFFAGGHLRFVAGAWRDDDGDPVDVVEVVRCRECKNYHHYGKTSLLVDGRNIKAGWCQRRFRYDEEHRMLPGDFCSYGKRKDR